MWVDEGTEQTTKARENRSIPDNGGNQWGSKLLGGGVHGLRVKG